MKTYTELIDIVRNNRETIVELVTKAHRCSLASDQPDTRCSIVALGRDDGGLVHDSLGTEEKREDLYILAAFPHISPIEAVVLYADEKAAILSNWCLEQGSMAPEQDEEEGDVAYLARLVAWIREYTDSTAGEILRTLIREQLLASFDADSEIDDALAELDDLSRGIVRRVPEDDDEAG